MTFHLENKDVLGSTLTVEDRNHWNAEYLRVTGFKMLPLAGRFTSLEAYLNALYDLGVLSTKSGPEVSAVSTDRVISGLEKMLLLTNDDPARVDTIRNAIAVLRSSL